MQSLRRRTARDRERMSLFEPVQTEEIYLGVLTEAIDALADLLLGVLHGPQKEEDASDECEDHT